MGAALESRMARRTPISAVKTLFHKALLTAAIVLATASAQAQLDGRGLMLEGNALVKSGLYHAALIRYREAAAAGEDSALFHYNLGIVYYRLEAYAEAETSLRRASQDPDLTSLATYNLGLVQLAAGADAEAESTFLAVANSASGRRLRKSAEQIAEKLAGSPGPANAAPARRANAARFREPPHSRDLRVRTLVRYAQDSNVYRAPSAPYVDLSDPTNPTIAPVVHSGSFIPVDVLAEYVLLNEAEDTEFFVGYRANADFYDAPFSNATRVSQTFSFGADIVLAEEENRRRTLDSAFLIRNHRETNFNPDDGLDRDIDGEDISARFEYESAGTEIAYGHEIGSWQWGFDLRAERRQYQNAPIVFDYDHEYYYNGVWVEYAINSLTDVSFGMRRYRRIYDQRRARDLTGTLLSTNATLEYDYRGAQLGVSRQLGEAFEIGLDYLRLERIDGFVGYYDYTQDVVRLGAEYRPNSRLVMSAAAVRRVYDYPNAFAFNVAAGGRRELETTSNELQLEYAISDKLSIWASIESDGTVATDPRAAYDQSLSMLGVKWRR